MPILDTLIVDLASANTWVGANKSRPYKTTSTSVKTSDFLVSNLFARGFPAQLKRLKLVNQNISYSGGAITAFG